MSDLPSTAAVVYHLCSFQRVAYLLLIPVLPRYYPYVLALMIPRLSKVDGQVSGRTLRVSKVPDQKMYVESTTQRQKLIACAEVTTEDVVYKSCGC